MNKKDTQSLLTHLKSCCCDARDRLAILEELVGLNASMLSFEVPDIAFLDVNNPTTAEAKIWGDANITEELRRDGAMLWYGNAIDEPDIVWIYNVDETNTIQLTIIEEKDELSEYRPNTVYVATSGDDATGAVGYAHLPFQSPLAAINAAVLAGLTEVHMYLANGRYAYEGNLWLIPKTYVYSENATFYYSGVGTAKLFDTNGTTGYILVVDGLLTLENTDPEDDSEFIFATTGSTTDAVLKASLKFIGDNLSIGSISATDNLHMDIDLTGDFSTDGLYYDNNAINMYMRLFIHDAHITQIGTFDESLCDVLKGTATNNKYFIRISNCTISTLGGVTVGIIAGGAIASDCFLDVVVENVEYTENTYTGDYHGVVGVKSGNGNNNTIQNCELNYYIKNVTGNRIVEFGLGEQYLIGTRANFDISNVYNTDNYIARLRNIKFEDSSVFLNFTNCESDIVAVNLDTLKLSSGVNSLILSGFLKTNSDTEGVISCTGASFTFAPTFKDLLLMKVDNAIPSVVSDNANNIIIMNTATNCMAVDADVTELAESIKRNVNYSN